MKALSTVLFMSFVFSAAVFGCEFKYDPASVPQYYKADGWYLPGIDDYNRSGEGDSYGMPTVRNVPNAKAYFLPHGSPYVVKMPSQIFTLNGERKRMKPVVAKAVVVRWEIDGKVVAYSYSLIPVYGAHKKNGKWVTDREAACLFEATFIDDKGDGVFRVLVPDSFRPELIPAWIKQDSRT